MKKYRAALTLAMSAVLVLFPVCSHADGICDVTYNDGTLFVTMNSSVAENVYFFINSVSDDGKKTIVMIKEVQLDGGDFVYIEQMNDENAKKCSVGVMYKNSLKPISRHKNIAAAANARELTPSEREKVKQLNEDIAKSLMNAYDSLYANKDFFSRTQYKIVTDVMKVFKDASEKSDEFVINKATIKLRYSTEIDRAKQNYDKLSNDGKTSFKTTISQIDADSFEYIKEFFDIDINDYDKE